MDNNIYDFMESSEVEHETIWKKTRKENDGLNE